MKTAKTFLSVIIIIAGFCSCHSARSVQLLLNKQCVDLDYELISTVFEGERDKTVYLNFIDNSKMEQHTVVKNGSVLVLPFFLYNYWHKKFNIVLGEHTLSQPYREFLADALLAECNRSASFSLKMNADESLPNYTLDVQIIRNKTRSGIQETNTIFIVPILFSDDFDVIITNNYHVLPTSSDLEIAVFLKKDSLSLLEKKYNSHQYFKYKSYGDLLDTNEKCVYKMTQCLAFATEQIVTDICRDLNLILSAQ